MPEAVIVAASRSPIGRSGKGSLRTLRPDDLAAQIVTAALAQVPELDPAEVEDLYLGAADHWGEQSQNLARVVGLLAGLDSVPGATVNRFCASSLQTTAMALHAIRAGEGDVFVSAGVESCSRYVPLADVGWSKADFHNPRFAASKKRTAAIAAENRPWTDPRAEGLLPDIYATMGQTAENVATLRGVSRQRQDEWAVLSQNRAEAAIEAGFFATDITPVTLPDGTVVSTDDGPRPGTTYEKVAALQPVFREDGTVTAGNACPLNDGSAALVVMSDIRARELGIEPLARIVATAATGLDPEIMGLGPVEASRKALARAGLSMADIDLVELNEAFAAQVLPSMDDLGIDPAILNVNGGAIALGHPFGATGARIATTLIHGLQERDGRYGLETMCVGGGQGMAMVLERLR